MQNQCNKSVYKFYVCIFNHRPPDEQRTVWVFNNPSNVCFSLILWWWNKIEYINFKICSDNHLMVQEIHIYKKTIDWICNTWHSWSFFDQFKMTDSNSTGTISYFITLSEVKTEVKTIDFIYLFIHSTLVFFSLVNIMNRWFIIFLNISFLVLA